MSTITWKYTLNGFPNHYNEEITYMDTYENMKKIHKQQIWNSLLKGTLLYQILSQKGLLKGNVTWSKNTIKTIFKPNRHYGIFDYYGYIPVPQQSDNNTSKNVTTTPYPPTVQARPLSKVLPWSINKIKGIQDIAQTVDKLIHVKTTTTSTETGTGIIADGGLYESFHHILITPKLNL